MTTTSSEIENIKNLFLKGDFYKVITLTDKILENESSSKLDIIHANLLKGRSIAFLRDFEQRREQVGDELPYFENAVEASSQLDDLVLQLESLKNLKNAQMNLNRYDDALQTIDKIEQIYQSANDLPPSEQKHAKAIILDCKASKINIEFTLGRDTPENRIELLIKNRNERLKFYQELNLQVECIELQYNIAYQYNFIGEYNKALQYAENGLKLSEKVANKYSQSAFLISIAEIYWYLGKLDKMPEYIEIAIKLDEELGNKLVYGGRQNMLGIFYAEKGDWDKALEHFKKALEHWENNNQKRMIINGYNNIGVFYRNRGDIDKALTHFLKAQELREELEIPGTSRNINNIAYMYYLKGDLDKAYDLLKKEIEVDEKYKNMFDLSGNLYSLSEIYWQQGKIKEAFSARERCLKLRKELGNKIHVGYALGSMIIFHVETNQHEQAKDCLEEFKSIVAEIDHKPLLLNYRFSEALVLKISSQQRDRIKAEVLFEQLLEEELLYSLHIDVLLHLSELLLNEIKNTNDETILEKVKKHINKLYDFAVSNNSPLLMVEALWLQAQIAMIELDIKNAQKILEKAQKIVDEKGLKKIASKIFAEKEKLDELSSELIEAGKQAYTISKRMELVKVQNTIKEIRKSRLIEDSLEDISSSKPLFSLRI
ncbi:MAG: tetratricopeptide repeat protein [Asgard group archaeon]|nr:tetratricopeptide repeat protein [Asgard group archaeon]